MRHSLHFWLSAVALLALFVLVFWLCDFAIIESDYSWHVAAGRLMRSNLFRQGFGGQDGFFIRTDPFAWTREGMPYGSNHEWLAQILLSFAADYGSGAVVVFRSFLVATSLSIVLLIGGQRAWIGLPLALLVFIPSIGAFMDRPQLFTFLLFSISLCTATRFLQSRDARLLILFPLLQTLWVNMHGGAAVLNAIIVFALLIQSAWDAWRGKTTQGAGIPLAARRRVILIGLTLLSLLPMTLISPMGFENVTYLLRLQGDATVNVIKEWMPRSLSTYAAAWWPVYGLLIASMILGKRHVPFAIVLLLPLMYLSRSAYRHEVLFGLGALGVAMMQLPLLAIPEACPELRRMGRERRIAIASIVIALSFFALYQARNASWGFVQRERAYGALLRDRTAGAVAFLDRAGLSPEKTFNTYNIGGELIGHGRTVFADGRNIDYGDAYLTALFAGATSTKSWKALEDRYGFTVAIVDYQEPDGSAPMPYIDHLSENPAWLLVYLDDFIAVYVKDVPSNHQAIQRYMYRYIDPTGIRPMPNPTPEDLSRLQSELLRMMQERPDGIRAPIMLSRLYAANGALAEAENLLRTTVASHKDDHRPNEALALLLLASGRFEEAAEEFDRMLSLLGNIANDDIREGIAEAFEKYGATEFAERYR